MYVYACMSMQDCTYINISSFHLKNCFHDVKT